MSPSRRLCLLAEAAWLLLAGCSGEISATPAATASLAPFSSATVTRTPTAWVATPIDTVELEPTPTPFVHVVTKGETLLEIAIKYGVELDKLLAANPDIDPHFLSVGQSLNIPGPNGEPVQSLLPTSTPMPLILSATYCTPTPSDQLICVVTISNPTQTAVEAVSVQISLLDSEGATIDSQLAYAPLNLLPPGAEMPLTALFARPQGTVAGAQTEIRGAVTAQTPSDRYLKTDVGQPHVQFSADRRQATIEGSLAVSTATAAGDWREGILAIAYDASGTIVGFAKWESGEDPVHDEHHDFSMDVFSLGPPIDHIAYLSEARLLVPVTVTPGP